MTEEVLNVGDEEQVIVQRTKKKTDREREVEELKDILNTYGGRAFIWRILSRCGVFKSSFTGDHLATYFNEGKRNIGLNLLTELFDVDASAFQKMQQEAVTRGDK